VAPPTLTAVVVAYWPERFGNVDRIIDDLQTCLRPPDTLIVLNNNPECPERFLHIEGIRHIRGSNWECRGKYVAGFLVFADYYLLMDDDITVSQRTTTELMRRAHPECMTANRGIVIRDGSFFAGDIHDANDQAEDVPVDSLCGSALFASHAALVRTLGAEMPIRHKWPTQGDDILAGLANDAVIWPMPEGCQWKELPDGGVAMNFDDDYYDMRDLFTIDALRALGKKCER